MSLHQKGALALFLLCLAISIQIYWIGFAVRAEPSSLQQSLARQLQSFAPESETASHEEVDLLFQRKERGRLLVLFRSGKRPSDLGLAIWEKGFNQLWRPQSLRLTNQPGLQFYRFRAGGEEVLALYPSGGDWEEVDLLHPYRRDEAFYTVQGLAQTPLLILTSHEAPELFRYLQKNSDPPLLRYRARNGEILREEDFPRRGSNLHVFEARYELPVMGWSLAVLLLGLLLSLACLREGEKVQLAQWVRPESVALSLLSQQEAEGIWEKERQKKKGLSQNTKSS